MGRQNEIISPLESAAPRPAEAWAIQSAVRSPCCAPARDAPLPVLAPASPGASTGNDVSLRVGIPGGRALVGTNRPFLPADGEGPRRSVRLEGFDMDAHAVSNARFGRFAEATGYVTEAERFGWSFVFHAFLRDRRDGPVGAAAAPWWRRVEGACWSRPEGPD